MITQRYGNNIPLRITLATSLLERSVDVKVLRQQGRTVPFSFTIEGDTIIGTVFGKDTPNRPDILSLRITLDAGTERQQIIDVPNVVRLVGDSQSATLLPTQMINIVTNGIQSTIIVVEIPRPRKTVSYSSEKTIPSHETMAKDATPDIVLS